jgi:hypothetical protein
MGAPEERVPEDRPPAGPAAPLPPGVPPPQRYGRYVGLFALLILVLITVNTIVTKHNGSSGVAPGAKLPPFAAPLALGGLGGDVNIATVANEGGAGKVPACSVRGRRVLNICEQYERGPVVLALFINGGSCANVLGYMQPLVHRYPGVRFVAVALGGSSAGVSALVRSKQLAFPVAVDRDGALVALYKVASCPQVSFAYPGGIVQSKALLGRTGSAALKARVGELVAAARARGWREPARERAGARRVSGREPGA